MKSDFNAKYYLTGQVLEGINTTDLLICRVRPYLSSFGNFAVILYISKKSSYDFFPGFQLFVIFYHFTRTPESLTPCTLWDHFCSIGDAQFILS